MSKKFNLVYDSKGTLKGSYSGIPGKDDVSLIERAVLDGSKPAPSPSGGVDTNYITHWLDDGDGNIFRMLCSGEYEEGFCADFINYMLANGKWFAQLPIDNKEGREAYDCIITRIEPTNESSADLCYCLASDPTKQFVINASGELDAETGDAIIVYGEAQPLEE